MLQTRIFSCHNTNPEWSRPLQTSLEGINHQPQIELTGLPDNPTAGASHSALYMCVRVFLQLVWTASAGSLSTRVTLM